MFGYVRPYKSELLVKEYEQYKAVYCQLCRKLGQKYGWLTRMSLNYECTFYALLALSVKGAALCQENRRCVCNPLKKCTYLSCTGEEYDKACALSVLLTEGKLLDNVEDDGFWSSLGARLLLPSYRRKAKKARSRYPFLGELVEEALAGQRQAEQEQAGPDRCAEPTALLLKKLFAELAGEDRAAALALEELGYFLGRWIYLMDASDDLKEDLKEGSFNPLVAHFHLEGKKELSPQEQKEAEERCNQVLNSNIARMLPALNLLEPGLFSPILSNVVEKGLPELQREILFLHVKERRNKREP